MARRNILSDLDQRLIVLLKEDARRSISELAALLDVSRTTVSDHMDRLKKTGVIKRFTIETAETETRQETGVGAFFHLKLRRPVCTIVYSSIEGWPEIIGCWSISGGTDMTIHVHCRSYDRLDELRDKLALHPEVETLWTATILRQWMQRMNGAATYMPVQQPDRLDKRLAEISTNKAMEHLNDGLTQAR